MKKKLNAEYFHVNCFDEKANAGYQHYFRLYEQKDGDIPRLIDQGITRLIDKEQVKLVDLWEEKYDSRMRVTNPYEDLD